MIVLTFIGEGVTHGSSFITSILISTGFSYNSFVKLSLMIH